MGFNDFFINNNGKKEQLKDIKHGVRKEQVDKKFHNLFDAYDVNKDGTLEANELEGIFKGLKNFAGSDKVLDSKENDMVKSVFENEVHIQDVDFQGFVKSVSTASDEIVESKETPTPDGGKEVTTTYKDGTVETIAYYPDGEYKFKKVDAQNVSTSYYYTVGNNLDKKYTTEQIEDVVKKEYENEIAKRARNLENSENQLVPLYNEFKNEFLKQHNVNLGSDTKSTERHNVELSERAKQDVAVKDFVLNHYIETHQAAKETLDTMGMLDDIGAAINVGAGELWNSCKNLYNKYIGEGTEEDYKNFYELVKTFEPNHDKSLLVKGAQEVAQRHQENYFRNEIGKIDTEKGAKFQQITEQYQNAQILKQRLNLLDKAMKEIELYTTEQLSVAMPNDIKNPIAHINNANKLLLEYFGGDQNAVDMILDGAIGDENSKVITAINNVKQETEKLNQSVLGRKSFDEIQEEYKTQYKEMYNTDFVPDELTEKVIDAKATGGFVKLAAITAISILITRSPAMTEVMGAVAGSAEATGVAANFMRTLVSRYGQTAVQQAIKLAMTSGTLATDVGLTLLNQATSERGINGEELWENTKSSAKYIFFGAYVGAPVAEAVGSAIGKFGLTRELMAGGRTTTQGAIKTTTLTGDKVFENVLKNGKSIGRKLMVGGAKLGTDVAMFSALGIATDGQEIGEAFEEQATFLPKLKIMNHVLEYVLGRVVGRGAISNQAQSPLINKPFDARMEKAIKLSGIENWTVKEMQTPNGSRYTIVDEIGITQTFNDVNKLATAMLEKVAKTYEEVKSVNNEESGEKKAETTQENSSEEKAESTPTVKAVTEKVFDETTIPQTKAILEEFGFSKEEIATIDLKDADVQRFSEAIHNIVKYEPRLKENFDNQEILELLRDKELLKEFLAEEGKYYTNENCELIDKHVVFDRNGGLSKIFSNNSNPETLIKLLPVLTQNGKYKVLGSELQRLGYLLDKPSDVAKIIPENVEMLQKINARIENKEYALELCAMLSFEEGKLISEEFIDNYVKETNRFAKYELTDVWEENLTEKLNKRKAISDFLEEYPIDMTVKDTMTGKDTKLNPETILQLSQTTDKSATQKFVNSLSKEAKAGVVSYIGFIEKGFPAEKLTDLLNTVCGKDFGEIEGGIRPLIKKMLETGSTDYDGMVKLIKSYKDTKCLSWYGNERFVQVANNDYTGAAKYIELAKELKMDEEYFHYLLKDENADFKSVVECLSYIKENNIDISTYKDYSLLRDRNWKENIAKIEYLKQQGIKTCDKLYVEICDAWKSDITFDEFKSKYEFVSSNDYINSHDYSGFMQNEYGVYAKTKMANTDLSLQEIKELTALAQKNYLQQDGILGLLCESNKLKYNLAKKITTDTDFPEAVIGEVLRATDSENFTLSEKLCVDKDFPKEQIANILRMTDENNLKKVTNICQNYKEYGIYPKQITELIPVFDDIKLECFTTIRENVSESLFKNLSAKDFVVLTNNTNLLSKKSIEVLQKSEKYDFMNFLLTNKGDICDNKMNKIKEAIPIMPTNEKEYASIMKEIAESLNISFDKLTPKKQTMFDSSMNSLSSGIKDLNLADLSAINLKYSQKEFVNDVNELLKDLPEEEQIKLQNKFGFRIINDKLTGYPKTVKDINAIKFENKELLDKVNEKVNSFLNNNTLTVKDNPKLNSLLNDLFNHCPEILNQIDGTPEFANTVKRLQTIVNNEEFKALSDSDKKIVVLATLIENTDITINTSKEAAFDAFFIGQKYGLSDNEAKKLYYIVEAGSSVETFMQTTKDITIRKYRASQITGQERQDKFDLMALNLKEDNCLKMAQMLYSSKYPKGFTRNFDKALENRVSEIKSQDFILPQTPSETYQEYAVQKQITKGENTYSVNVVKAKDIPNLYAFVHTPEAGFATGGSRGANFANFEAFATLNDNKVICTSYVSADKAGLVREFHNGFIFEVQNDKQYVAYGRDIFSLGKNIQDIVVEYYRDKGFKAAQNKGEKYDHRTLMSNIIKQILFGKDYYQMSKDVVTKIAAVKANYTSKLQTLKSQRQNIIKNTFGTNDITNAQYRELKSNADFANIEKQINALSKQELAEIENIPEYKELKDMDNRYIARLDNVKAKLGDKPMTLENIKDIDSELADAYKAFLDRDGANKAEEHNSVSLLRSSWHNEALVSNPKITGIFTDNIENIPEEYLIKAKDENLPIVVFDVSK